jgi:outer membrane protein
MFPEGGATIRVCPTVQPPKTTIHLNSIFFIFIYLYTCFYYKCFKMKIKNYLLFLIFFLIYCSQIGFAQSDILDNYVKEALANNLGIQSEILKKDKQYSKVEQAKKLWNPTVDLNASYLFAEGGRELLFPLGDLFNPVYGTLNQLTSSTNFPTNIENENIQLAPNNFLDLQLTISKPLLNSSIKYNQKIQQELLRINDFDLALSKKETIAQIKVGYYNYLKTFEGLAIMNETERLLQEILTFNKKLVKYDKATPDVLSDVEFQIANLQSQKAMLMEQQDLAKAYFNLLLNKSLDAEVIVDGNILKGKIQATENITSLKSKAMQSRLEFKKMDVASVVNSLNQKRINQSKKPTLGISGGIGLQTESFNFENGGPLYTLGLGMNWSLIDGGLRKKKIEEIHVDQRILENDRKRLSQQIEMQVIQIFYKMRSLEIRMQAEEVAVKSAKKSYRAINARYRNDKAILIELTQAQNSLTNSEMSKALSKYDYLILLAELENVIGE